MLENKDLNYSDHFWPCHTVSDSVAKMPHGTEAGAGDCEQAWQQGSEQEQPAVAVRYISPVKSPYSGVLGCKSPGPAGIALEEECVAGAVQASISEKCRHRRFHWQTRSRNPQGKFVKYLICRYLCRPSVMPLAVTLTYSLIMWGPARLETRYCEVWLYFLHMTWEADLRLITLMWWIVCPSRGVNTMGQSYTEELMAGSSNRA